MYNLYYGNGNCTVEGTNIRGVQIKYRGTITITKDKTSSSFAIAHRNKGIMVYPIGRGEYLNELFDYEGEFHISSILVGNEDAELVYTNINRVMDYSELIYSNAEDMTNLSEELSAGYTHGTKPSISSSEQEIVPNLSTADNIKLYYADGIEFHGSFHIHLKDSGGMTGATHTEESQDLYYMMGEKLTPTKNSSLVPRGAKKRRRFRKKR
tara:strand:+ start:2502 stop:3131 length:630 start_codon:yes stop_codon:yes gene_type:complete